MWPNGPEVVAYIGQRLAYHGAIHIDDFAEEMRPGDEAIDDAGQPVRFNRSEMTSPTYSQKFALALLQA